LVPEGAPDDPQVLWRALNDSLDRLEAIEALVSRYGEPDRGMHYPLDASGDNERYERWLNTHEAATIPPCPTDGPVISVLVPVHDPPAACLRSCIESVRRQTYDRFELCLADDASTDPEVVAVLAGACTGDSRVKLTTRQLSGGISAATNDALAMARGELVAFLDHDDEITPDALAWVAQAVLDHDDADVIYSDEDKLDMAGRRVNPFLKPGWAPDLLLSFPYLCHLLVVRRTLVEEVGGLRSAYDGSQDYDLMLRTTESARRVHHIPRVLYHWRRLEGSTSSEAMAKPWAHDASRRALADALSRRGIDAAIEDGPGPGWYNVRRRPPRRPLVSIIVPYRDQASLTRQCVDSLYQHTDYDNWELLLVDNASREPETSILREALGRMERVRLLESSGPFNWSVINNAAAKEARGELLLFLNNDIEATDGRWLDAMVGHGLRDEVGAVGARLLFPYGRVQHAGVVVGLGGLAGHIFYNLPADRLGYMGMAKLTTNYSAVTGACMLTRAELFGQLGGFDESMAVAFSDIDYCLRLRELGYLHVYTPLAELVHHESVSRGIANDRHEVAIFYPRWRALLQARDPYLNANLSRFADYGGLALDDEESRRLRAFLDYHLLEEDGEGIGDKDRVATDPGADQT
jgi:GT2 family glycosyltransferase